MTLEIAGLKANLREVPEAADQWLTEWVPKALAFRAYQQDRCLRDTGARDDTMALCAEDPLYEFLVFGCVFEPRSRELSDGTVREAGWYPWIPYHFQGLLLRAIQEARAARPGTPAARLGRGDLVVEKARGMAGSWTFCGAFANRWRHADGYVGAMMSYKEDLVDKRFSTDALFYKIRGYLGLDERVPKTRIMRVGDTSIQVPIRPPEFLVPKGTVSQDLIIVHPERNNSINGYSTGERTGVGGRASEFLLDEAAKFPAFPVTWNSLSAVTDNRYANSSADVKFGTGFRDLARHAERAVANGTPGPTFIRLRPEQHPERDSVWREEIEARHASNPFAQQMMAAEYDLDYEAGHGAHIYPAAHAIEPKPLSFHPGKQSLDFCIDPGIRDMTAFHLVSYDPGEHRYGLLASYANSGKPADFYASLVCASPVGSYDYGEEEYRIMEWFDQYGKHIRFWVGDPAGKARGGGQATSFYDDFRLATLKLTDGRKAISIWNSDKKEHKFLQPRIAAMRWILSILDVNNEPDTIRTLEAIRDHRFRSMKEGHETSNPMADPVRTWGIDRVAAIEYYACHRKVGNVLSTQQVAKPTRVNIGGKPWANKRKKIQSGWDWR